MVSEYAKLYVTSSGVTIYTTQNTHIQNIMEEEFNKDKYIITATKDGVTALGTNGYGDASAMGISLFGAIVVEVILTFVFVYTILGVTSDENKSSVAGIVIGLVLTFVHLLGIKLTGSFPAASGYSQTSIYFTNAF